MAVTATRCSSRGRPVLMFATIFLCAGLAPSSYGGLIGVSFSGNAFEIDETTGIGTLLGSSGFTRLNGAASDSSGVVYTASSPFDGVGGELITIDTVTGAGTSVVGLDDQFNGIRGLAFAPDGILFAAVDVGDPGDIGPDSLFTIDPTTGSLSLVGSTGLTGLQGLAFSGNSLFGWEAGSSSRGLFSIDPTTGIATRIGGSFDLQALEFASDGTLYGARNALYTINTGTGLTTFVGSGGYSDIRGLAFAEPSRVPEPTAAALVSLGLLGLFRDARRRS